jgi:spore germination protein
LKRFAIVLVAIVLPFLLLAQENSPTVSFNEVWAYLMEGDEKTLDSSLPITDVGYFSAILTDTGELGSLPSFDKIADFKGRKHLVIEEIGSYALTHFVIDSSLPLKRTLIEKIVSAAAPYDGVQIDFEAVLSRDAELFYSFLAELRSRLGGKVFSIAVPPRVSDVPGTVWDYAKLDTLADRIIIMAYDEHWATSAPGSVASLEWGRRVAAYAQTRIAPERLVMGNPFYGRAWADRSFSRSYRYPSIQKLIAEEKVKNVKREKEVPYFDYEKKVKVRVYYEDLRSLMARLSIYRDLKVDKVSFWCLGQEDKRVWAGIGLVSPELPAALPASIPSLPPYSRQE